MIKRSYKQSDKTLADSFLNNLGTRLQTNPADIWPKEYRNRDTKRIYKPHNEEEHDFVFTDQPRYYLCKGGEGSGKTVAGIIKVLERLKRGMTGAMLSPDFPHFKKSLWPEFVRWCPVDVVIPQHRYRLKGDYSLGADRLIFISQYGTYVTLYMGGIDNPLGWEGPNLSFIHFDEAQRKKSSLAFEVMAGRIRIPGPQVEPPQLFITTVPIKNWLFTNFGPLIPNDPKALLKKESKVITLKTIENIGNLDSGFIEARSATLDEVERKRRMEAEWVDDADHTRFLPNMLLWDRLKSNDVIQKPLTKKEDLVVALDAAVSGDHFALVGVTRDPTNHDEGIWVRYVQQWKPPKGGVIDYRGTPEHPGPELVLRRLCLEFNVVQVCYDPYQLHDFAMRIGDRGEGLAWFKAFPQSGMRLNSDKTLFDLIIQKRVWHTGNEDLRKHMDNADKKLDKDNHKLRLVKREPSLKIDLAVALSMSSYSCLQLNL